MPIILLKSLGEAQFATAVITLTVSFARTWPEGNQTSYILFVESRSTRGFSTEARSVDVTLDPWHSYVDISYKIFFELISFPIIESHEWKVRGIRRDIPEIRRGVTFSTKEGNRARITIKKCGITVKQCLTQSSNTNRYTLCLISEV